ncbi:MAG: tyrosine-type recombinase/integrase [Campylobacterales bacterium]
MPELKSRFLGYLEQIRGRAKSTIETYEPDLAEAIALVEIDEKRRIVDLMPYREAIARHQAKTIAKKLSALRSMLTWLEEIGYRFRVRGLESVKTPKTLPKPVSHAHILEAIDSIAGENRLLLWLMYGLGLRISEAASLKIADITPGWARVTGKGNKTRQVPVLGSLQLLIDKHLQTHSPREFLFEDQGKRLSENQLRYRIVRSFEKVGLKVTPHQLRHAFATELLNGGARITDVSELLGHARLGTTEIYTKLTHTTKLNNYLSAHPLCKDPHGD